MTIQTSVPVSACKLIVNRSASNGFMSTDRHRNFRTSFCFLRGGGHPHVAAGPDDTVDPPSPRSACHGASCLHGGAFMASRMIDFEPRPMHIADRIVPHHAIAVASFSFKSRSRRTRQGIPEEPQRGWSPRLRKRLSFRTDRDTGDRLSGVFQIYAAQGALSDTLNLPRLRTFRFSNKSQIGAVEPRLP
jgi:hypothetical protein